MELKKLFQKTMSGMKKESPKILTSFVLLGVIGTGYYAYKAGLKADSVLQYYRTKKMGFTAQTPKDSSELLNQKEEIKQLKIETAKELIPILLPPVIIGATTMGCAIGSTAINQKRIAVLSTAYALSERTVTELNKKMISTIGEKKTKEVKDAIMEDRIKQNPPSECEIINTGYGNVLCTDYYTGRYFRSSVQKIGEAVNALSADVITDMYVSLNDFYDLLNIPRVPMGDDFGWNIDDTDRGRLPISFDSAVLTADGLPCLCVEYDAKPRDDFRNLH